MKLFNTDRRILTIALCAVALALMAEEASAVPYSFDRATHPVAARVQAPKSPSERVGLEPLELPAAADTGAHRRLAEWSRRLPPRTTVPEPSTLALIGIGLLGIIGFHRPRFSKGLATQRNAARGHSNAWGQGR